MVNYREILRLISLGYSQRQIAASSRSSRNTVKDVLEAAQKAEIQWPLDDSITNEVLEATFHPDRPAAVNPRCQATNCTSFRRHYTDIFFSAFPLLIL
jgi:hypothetical protein